LHTIVDINISANRELGHFSTACAINNKGFMRWRDSLAEQIKDARESANMTQEQLAHRLKVTRQMISRYETGRDVPVIDVLALMALELDTKFKVNGIEINVEASLPRLRAMPKQLRLDFEKAQEFRRAIISITPRDGEIFITAKIPA
jgi:transcriptional regulator with XRE-family HTH domain